MWLEQTGAEFAGPPCKAVYTGSIPVGASGKFIPAGSLVPRFSSRLQYVGMQLAVLFGAGASYGCGTVMPGRIPLGRELFGELCREFPQTWGTLITPRERDAFREDPPFEKGMEILWKASDERLQFLLIDMAIYFARFSLTTPENEYTRLLAAIGYEQLPSTVFASLNYDCLFEYAADWKVRYVAQDAPLGSCVLLKPHGSCNFVATMTKNVIDCAIINVDRFYEGPLEAVHPSRVAELYTSGPSIPPALSLYAAGKGL
jgi:hypothetical protein